MAAPVARTLHFAPVARGFPDRPTLLVCLLTGARYFGLFTLATEASKTTVDSPGSTLCRVSLVALSSLCVSIPARPMDLSMVRLASTFPATTLSHAHNDCQKTASSSCDLDEMSGNARTASDPRYPLPCNSEQAGLQHYQSSFSSRKWEFDVQAAH